MSVRGPCVMPFWHGTPCIYYVFLSISQNATVWVEDIIKKSLHDKDLVISNEMTLDTILRAKFLSSTKVNIFQNPLCKKQAHITYEAKTARKQFGTFCSIWYFLLPLVAIGTFVAIEILLPMELLLPLELLLQFEPIKSKMSPN